MRETIICLLFAIIIIVPLYFDTTFEYAFDTSKFIALVVLVAALACCVSLDRKVPRFRTPLTWPIISFWVISGLATIFSVNQQASLFGVYRRFDGFISLTAYMFLYFVIINYVSVRMVRGLCDVLIWVACLASAYGICQHFGLDGFIWADDFGHGGRVFSTFGHPAFFSAFLAMVFPLVLYRVFSDNRWYFFAMPLILSAIYYTKTRASFLGLIISTLFFCWISRKSLLINKRAFAIYALMFVLILVVNSNYIIKRFTSDIGTNGELQGSASERIGFALVAVEIIKDNPLFGVGPDAMVFVYVDYLKRLYPDLDYDGNKFAQSRAHNEFLDMAVSRGLLGLAVWVWLITAFIIMVWRQCDKVLVSAFCAGLLSYFIQGMFSFGHISFIVVFWYFIGMAAVVCSQDISLR